jgi:2-polyprenyl-3-methyl-5-hydroxy-6-metoxy-1,4-benzoquinol methylase
VADAPSDRLRDVYEQRAELQYAQPVELPDPRVDRKFARLTALVLDRLPAEAMLDAGCGDGRFLAAIARDPRRPRRLVGTDISERILETARSTVEREGASIELVQANLERLPFPDETFDLVLSAQVIEHLLDVAAGIRELARVLQPNGTLVLSTDNARNRISQVLNAPRTAAVRALRLTGRHAVVTFPHVSFTRTEVAGHLAEAGLRVEHAETFRFHLDGRFDGVSSPRVQRVLNVVDEHVPAHGFGDIVAFVARKPPRS